MLGVMYVTVIAGNIIGVIFIIDMESYIITKCTVDFSLESVIAAIAISTSPYITLTYITTNIATIPTTETSISSCICSISTSSNILIDSLNISITSLKIIIYHIIHIHIICINIISITPF
jgi:hypothetical protein